MKGREIAWLDGEIWLRRDVFKGIATTAITSVMDSWEIWGQVISNDKCEQV